MKFYYELKNFAWSTIDALESVTLFFKPHNADVYIEQNKERPYNRRLYVSVNRPLSECDISCVNRYLSANTMVIAKPWMTSELYNTCKNHDKIEIRYGDENYYRYLAEYNV